MYKNISIKNFRCFRETNIKKFRQINLIGGQNNVGKTALLEALYLGIEPNELTIDAILSNRFQEHIIYENPENQPFKDFFYNQEEENIINIDIDDTKLIVETAYYSEKKGKNNNLIIKNAALDLEYYKNKILKERFKYSTFAKHETRPLRFIKNFMEKNSIEKTTAFFSTNNRLKNTGNIYEKIVVEGKKHYLLKAFQTIENDIVEVEYINNRLLLKRKNEKLVPINLFGDAMNKLCHWVLSIIAGDKKVILIDEVENGIHHSNQAKFWTMLFQLSKEFEVQIFATSHSEEMIKAFNLVAGNSDFEDDCMYFEMGRHSTTNEIIAIPMDMDTLNYKLLTGKPHRGE